MNTEEPTAQLSLPPAELELSLQEAHARRQRAADLFGRPEWDDTDDDDSDE